MTQNNNANDAKLNPEELRAMTPDNLLRFLLGIYTNQDVRVEGDPSELITSLSIGGIVSIAEQRYLASDYPSYAIGLYDQDINQLSDENAAMVILDSKNLCCIFKTGSAHQSDTVFADDELWNLAHKLFIGCQEKAGIKSPEQQNIGSLLTKAIQKQKKISNRLFALYVAAVLITFCVYNIAIQVRQKHHEQEVKEYRDSICERSQHTLDSLDAAIEQRKAVLEALDNPKQPRNTK